MDVPNPVLDMLIRVVDYVLWEHLSVSQIRIVELVSHFA